MNEENEPTFEIAQYKHFSCSCGNDKFDCIDHNLFCRNCKKQLKIANKKAFEKEKEDEISPYND